MWLANVPLAWIAATLGAALGPDWTAAAVVQHVTGQRGGRALLAEPAAPVAYLRTLLNQALTGDQDPPHPARRAIQARRAAVATAGTALNAHQAAARAALDERDQAAAPIGGRTVETELAALRARLPGHRRHADRVALLDGKPEQTNVVTDEEWPEVAQPGSGLPPASR